MNLKATETMRKDSNAAGAAAVLLRELIDYAGLFPPAALPMAPAVANYETYLRSGHNWILGRFILPVARLGEFEKAIEELAARAQAGAWSSWALSVLLGSDASADVLQIRDFNVRNNDSLRKAQIKSVEVKVVSPQDIERLSTTISAELETYFEIPLAGREHECIMAVAERGRRAKIRTGGETADKFPGPESVIEFIRQCAAYNVPFKATAGLHHPLRSLRRLTYQPDSPSGMMYGFLNVFLAAAFLRHGMEPKLAEQLLNEQAPQAFHFDSDGVFWRENQLTMSDIAAARHGFSLSFGSCSFVEPIEELQAIHIL